MNRPAAVLSWLLATALLAACATAPQPDAEPMPPHEHDEAEGSAHHGHHGHHDKRFTDAEQWAARFDDPERDAWQKPAEVVDALALEPGMIVADIGAGTGYFLPHLSPAVGDAGRVLALDIEPAMVDWMAERAARDGLTNVEPAVVAGDDPGLDPASVDRILIVDTWHHIPAREAYSARLAEALRPGGALVIVDFTVDSPMGPPAEHRLPPEAVIAELAAAGLRAVAVEETLPNQYIVVATHEQP